MLIQNWQAQDWSMPDAGPWFGGFDEQGNPIGEPPVSTPLAPPPPPPPPAAFQGSFGESRAQFDVAAPAPDASAPGPLSATIPDAPPPPAPIRSSLSASQAQIADCWDAHHATDGYRLFQQMSEHGWSVADVAQATGLTEQAVGDQLTRIGVPAGFAGSQLPDREAISQPYMAALQNAGAHTVGWHEDPPSVDEDGVVTSHSHFDVAEFTRWFASQGTPESQAFSRIYGEGASDGSNGLQFSHGAVLTGASTDESGTTYPPSLSWAKDDRIARYQSYARLSDADRAAISEQVEMPLNQKLLEVFGGAETLPNNDQGEIMRARYGTALATQLYRLDHATQASRAYYSDALNHAMGDSANGLGWKDSPTTITYDEDGVATSHTSRAFDELAFHDAFIHQSDPKSQLLAVLYGEATRSETGELVLQGLGGALRFTFATDESGTPMAATAQSEVPAGMTKVELGAPPDMFDPTQVGFMLGVGFVTASANIKPPKKKKNWLKTALVVVAVVAVSVFTAGTAAPALLGMMGPTFAAGTLGAAMATGAMVGAAASLTSGVLTTGKIDLKSMAKGALMGAVTGGVMNGLEGASAFKEASKAVQVGARMLVQGTLQEASGGDFKTGALAALGQGLGQGAQQLTAGLGSGVSNAVGKLVEIGVKGGDNPLEALAESYLGDAVRSVMPSPAYSPSSADYRNGSDIESDRAAGLNQVNGMDVESDRYAAINQVNGMDVESDRYAGLNQVNGMDVASDWYAGMNQVNGMDVESDRYTEMNQVNGMDLASDQYAGINQVNGMDVESDRVAGSGEQPKARSETLIQVRKDDTLESLAKRVYGKDWRAGMIQMKIDNQIRLNAEGSPIIREGATLHAWSLDVYPEDQLDGMNKLGGGLVKDNTRRLDLAAGDRIRASGHATPEDMAADPNVQMVRDSERRIAEYKTPMAQRIDPQRVLASVEGRLTTSMPSDSPEGIRETLNSEIRKLSDARVSAAITNDYLLTSGQDDQVAELKRLYAGIKWDSPTYKSDLAKFTSALNGADDDIVKLHALATIASSQDPGYKIDGDVSVAKVREPIARYPLIGLPARLIGGLDALQTPFMGDDGRLYTVNPATHRIESTDEILIEGASLAVTPTPGPKGPGILRSGFSIGTEEAGVAGRVGGAAVGEAKAAGETGTLGTSGGTANAATRPKLAEQLSDESLRASGANMSNIKVVAEGKVNGQVYIDTNQMARPAAAADAADITLVPAERVSAREAQGLGNVNGNMSTAHAEIGVIQQAATAGVARGADMTLTVKGEAVCTFCRGDIPAAAEAAGLKSLLVIEQSTGLTYYWAPGMKALRLR